MYYKQMTSGNQLISIGETIDKTPLPKYFFEISKDEYDALKKILTLEISPLSKLTPLNEEGELLL